VRAIDGRYHYLACANSCTAVQNLCPAVTLLASQACAGALALDAVTPSFCCTVTLRKIQSLITTVFTVCVQITLELHPAIPV